MTEQPLFLNSGNDRLFTIIHMPENDPVSGVYVFCHPFAEEKLWSHRVYVSFAREMAKLGYLVVRFDYRGYGDSDGDFIDVSINNHLLDIQTIIDAIVSQHSDIHKIGLFGLRFGGLIAALAAEQFPQVNQLILWEPIINGERYMQDMLRSNLAAQMAEKGRVEITREDLLSGMKTGNPVNIEGYPVSYGFYNEVSEMNLLNQNLVSQARCLINQVVRNIKQPSNKDMISLQGKYSDCSLQKSEELQFWKEIKEFYYSADFLSETTIDWLNGNNER